MNRIYLSIPKNNACRDTSNIKELQTFKNDLNNLTISHMIFHRNKINEK